MSTDSHPTTLGEDEIERLTEAFVTALRAAGGDGCGETLEVTAASPRVVCIRVECKGGDR